MRSLTLKLSLAFLAVGLTGALLVTLLLSRQTRTTFDRFIINEYQDRIVPQLVAYYTLNESWDGIADVINTRGSSNFQNQQSPGAATGPGPSQGPGASSRNGWDPGAVLLDVDGTVLVPGLRIEEGTQVDLDVVNDEVGITLNDELIGWLIIGQLESDTIPANSPEAIFLTNINRAAVISVVGATVIALLLGILLARTIARPVRKLTHATHKLAGGELGYQVDVETQDEIGELAESFNQMSADLAQSNQMRRQMTADIAHDLRTPLSVLIGYTEALSDGKLNGSPAIYGVMHKETQHLNHLIDDLRTLSLADAGELSLNQRAVTPRELLEHIALAQMTLAEEKGVALALTSAEALPPLFVDPDRMIQVLSNLTSNALRHTPAGGQVTLGAHADGKRVVLTVSDTGSGIPAQDLPHIFDRFYRGDSARSHDGSSGLGLAIARSIVSAHKGEISVVSAEGQGTTFSVSLPTVSSG